MTCLASIALFSVEKRCKGRGANVTTTGTALPSGVERRGVATYATFGENWIEENMPGRVYASS